MTIEVRGLTKRFGSFTALDRVSLEVADGELLALLGPSGSGKTTLLRIMAGLELADEGTVLVGGENLLARHPRERSVGFVFQHYALFRHMTVFENVAFGLRVRPRIQRPTNAEIRDRVGGLLDLVQLAPFSDRYPNQLSGGQRQRVALARALAIEPRVLLLDEPFGALDAKVRKDLRSWLRQLHDELHVTSVFVTHDQEEALELADRVVILNRGRIEQIGSPQNIVTAPANPFVCDFLGEMIPLSAYAKAGALHVAGSLEPIGFAGCPDGPVTAFLLSQDLELVRAGLNHSISATVLSVKSTGFGTRITLTFPENRLELAMPSDRLADLELSAGSRVGLRLKGGIAFPTEAHKNFGSQKIAPHYVMER